jgi:DNA-binding NarL/FixJ family response regulator
MNYSSSRRLNILVMHPDPLVRAGLLAALRQNSSFDVFVYAVDDLTSTGSPMQVVIADYDHAMLLADSAARGALGPLSESRILALTANDREADIRRAIQSGIHGYLLLGGSLDELIEAVSTVGNGVRYLCPIVAQRMADSLAGVTLTSRENQVLRLVACGESNKAIARQLTIELGTVKSHVSAIMTKLGAMSRTQAANIAATRGLLNEYRPARPAAFALNSHAGEPRPQLA